MKHILSQKLTILSIACLLLPSFSTHAGGFKRASSVAAVSVASFLGGMFAHPEIPSVPEVVATPKPEVPANHVYIHLKDREIYELDEPLVSIFYGPPGREACNSLRFTDKTGDDTSILNKLFKDVPLCMDRTVIVKPQSSWFWNSEDEEQVEMRYLIKSEHSELFDCKDKNRDCWCQKNISDSQKNESCWFKNHSRYFWQTISALKQKWSDKVDEAATLQVYSPDEDPEWLE